MNLGETIFRLRSERNLSQGSLADALGVSRQSISKWENNSAVPELDKLVKLSELFEITLDELVRGEVPLSVPEAVPAVVPQQMSFPPRKIAGTILLCMGALLVIVCTLLGSIFAGLLFASPLLMCGIVCFVFQQHVGLWCSWVVYFMVDVYVRYATGISWKLTQYTFKFTYEMNYTRLVMAWGQLFCMCFLVVVTVFRFRNTPLQLTGRNRSLLLVGWALLMLLHIPIPVPWGLYLRWWAFLIDWMRLGLFTFLLVLSVRSLHTRRGS